MKKLTKKSASVDDFDDDDFDDETLTKEERRQAYFDLQEKHGKFLQKNFFAAKLLYSNGIKIFNLNQANESLRNLLKLDEITEIDAIYKKDENGIKTEEIEKITKQNFYNAFYSPI